MTAVALLVAHTALCLVLIAGVIRRAVMMSEDVMIDVRLAFVLLGAVALFGLVAPLVLCWEPDPVSLSLAGSIALIQHVTARHWRYGVPVHYYRPHRRPGEKVEVAPVIK